MTIRLTREASAGLSLLCAAMLFAACGKKEDSGTQQQNPSPIGGSITVNQGGGAANTPADDSGIQRYGDEGPEIGTVLTKRVSIVRKAADQGAEILSRLGPGTAVNRRARHGPYYLVDYPTGAGAEMKPGWILQDDVNVQNTAVTHPTATVVTTATTATVTATTAAPVGGRPPPIVIKRKLASWAFRISPDSRLVRRDVSRETLGRGAFFLRSDVRQ